MSSVDVGTAFVRILPDTRDFRALLQAEVDKAVAQTRATVVSSGGAAAGSAAATTRAVTATESLAAASGVATQQSARQAAAALAVTRATIRQTEAENALTRAIAENADATKIQALTNKSALASESLRVAQLRQIESTKKVRTGLLSAAQESNALRGSIVGLTRVTPVAVFGLGAYGTAAIAAGLAVKAAVSSTAAFEHQLNIFQATSNATTTEMKQVRDEAKALGADLSLPSTSAGDAALAMTELSKAGLSVQDTLAGARGTLQLAAAAQIDVGTAATFVATELNAFQLAGSKATHVADLLAGASIAAQGDISDFGTAFQQVSAVSFQVGLSLERTTGALTALAKAGLKGADGGTSLRTTLLRLAPTTKQAAEFQKALGIEIDKNATIGEQLPRLLDEYKRALSALTPVEQQQALTQIFGQDAIRAASILIRGGSQALRDNTAAANQNGAANRLAQANAKGLSGAFNGLKSNLDTLGITLGSFVDGPLTGLVNVAAQGVGALNSLAQSAGSFWDKVPGPLKDILKGATALNPASAIPFALSQLGGDGKPKTDFTIPTKRPEEGLQGPGAPGLAPLTDKQKAEIRKRVEEANAAKRRAASDALAASAVSTDTQIAQIIAGASRSLQDNLVADRKAVDEIQAALDKELAKKKRDAKLIANLRIQLAQANAQVTTDLQQIEDNNVANAKKRASDALAAAKKRKEVSDAILALRKQLAQSSLDLQLSNAQLTPGISDDRRAYLAQIKAIKEDIDHQREIAAANKKNTKVRLEALDAIKQDFIKINGIKQDIRNLKDQSGAGAGFTLQDLFKEASDQFNTFGSNISGRNGVLSGQDARAALGANILQGRDASTRIQGGILTQAEQQTAILASIDAKLSGNPNLSAATKRSLVSQAGNVGGWRAANEAAAYAYGVN